MEHSKKYQPLARKIRSGKSFETAAIELGIAEEEWTTARKAMMAMLPELQTADLTLHKLAMDSIKTGVRHLKKIAEEGPRVDSSKEPGRDVDFQAAKALLDAGIKLRGTISASVEPAPVDKGKRDIFDLTGTLEIKGPWQLKEPGV